ncbi:MAG: rhomboid family intramembrane serine protease [Chryseobacterium sp. SCN 40-13]|nr:MAG: rhomboid family intramembrane serine protease [Chryseobacterium sp. SCN 40-13]
MFQNITPVTKTIIIINVFIFAFGFFAPIVFPRFEDYMAAYFPMSGSFRLWQIATHMFMHANWMHLLFNMFTLLSFGPVLERTLGDRKFVSFYFICGLGSFIIFNLWKLYLVQGYESDLIAMNFNPAEIYNNSDVFKIDKSIYARTLNQEQFNLYRELVGSMVGASGAIFGVITAFAILFPNAELFIMFIPVPVKAKYLLPVIILGSLFLGFRQFEGDNIAHFAHLGGALIGFLWIRNWKNKQNFNRFR